jgi:MoaA/NifB/PqqE/SkfB family radical SAM enzyme
MCTDSTNGLWFKKENKVICCNPWTHFEINNPNGDVTMCCDHHEVLGNVNDSSIEEIWNNKAYQAIRRQMLEDGAFKTCSSGCLLLNGLKDEFKLDWYKDINKTSDCYKNAELNNEEILEGKLKLKSLPRFMKIAISFKCNYKCYHCCQGDERILGFLLPESFYQELTNLSKYLQCIYIFGGEPLIFKEFSEILKIQEFNEYLKFGLVTNGSLIHKHIDEIKKANWSFFSISLDSATEESYSKLRFQNNWNTVLENLEMIKMLKSQKDFTFTLSMTVNSRNCHEIKKFVDLCKKYSAIPKINMVANPGLSIAFNHKYLNFSDSQKNNILQQIESIRNEEPELYPEIGLGLLSKKVKQYSYRQLIDADLKIIYRLLRLDKLKAKIKKHLS